MAAIDDFKQQLQDYKDQQTKALQGQIAGANENAKVWNWGGSSADREHWLRVASDAQNALKTLNTNFDPLMASVNSGALDPTQINLAKKYLSGDTVSSQAIDELNLEKKQANDQAQQLTDYRNAYEKQTFGGNGLSLSDALSNPQGDLGSLSNALKQQESDVFKQNLQPMLQMQLGAQGLADSGANVELQSKALGQLEQNRQTNLLNAALGARSQIANLGRQDLLGNIGYQQGSLSNLFDIQRAGITMQFQQQLEDQRAQLAKELAQYRGGGGSTGIGSLLGTGLGAAVGMYAGAGNPAFANLGATIGGQAGGVAEHNFFNG